MTPTQIETRLNRYYAAEADILNGAQSHEIDGEVFTYANLDVIARLIRALEHQLSAARSGNGGIRRYRTVL